MRELDDSGSSFPDQDLLANAVFLQCRSRGHSGLALRLLLRATTVLTTVPSIRLLAVVALAVIGFLGRSGRFPRDLVSHKLIQRSSHPSLVTRSARGEVSIRLSSRSRRRFLVFLLLRFLLLVFFLFRNLSRQGSGGTDVGVVGSFRSIHERGGSSARAGR